MTRSSPAASAPTVRTIYLVVDALLLVLAAELAFHAFRARTWTRRLAEGRHRRWLIGRTIAADLSVPMVVLLGLPLWIGSTGSSRPGDLLGGWRFALWTLPDLALALLILALSGLAIGAAKVIAVAATRQARSLAAAA